MSLQHFILGLLEEMPASGYDLNKRFQMSVQHFWTTDQSQIYRALHKLRDADLVRIEHIVQDGTPDKKVYHITDEGRDGLLEWLRAPLPDEAVKETWLGRIFFGGLLEPAENLEVLEQAKADIQARYDGMMMVHRNIAQYVEKNDISYKRKMHILTLDYGLELHRFLLGWLDSAVEKVQAIKQELDGEN